MKQKANLIAQKLVNLYRQEHVILGGWAALNPIFVKEGTDDVLDKMAELPTGNMLIQHIKNLRSGKTPMNTIDRNLLPYGGLMAESGATTPLTEKEWAQLQSGLAKFTPTEQGLVDLQKLAVVKKFGDEWLVGIKDVLADYPEMLEKWRLVMQTWRAYYLWDAATQIINQPLTERVRAQVQADMPEYETFLPMFADAGNQLLAKLRAFMKNPSHPDQD
ncbi:MAG: hypothetical protein J5608_01405 [Alphaproteobacteria bacterium]|nr:hypothetical protein [Alphaproteobacteria bacterium]